MRSLATATVFVWMCVFLLMPSHLPAAQHDDSQGLVTRVAEPAPRQSRACEVLWDLTHGTYAGSGPSGNHSNMADTLAAYGYASSETSAGLHNIDLAPYDVIVIGTLLAWNSAYTAAEVAAVQDFVTDGGALFIMGENTGCPNANINPVSEAFGTTCGAGDPFSSINSFSVHEIFTDVSSMELVACGELAASGSAAEHAWDYYGDPVITLVGDCTVVTVGDGNFCQDSYFGDADNKQFVLNAFFHLCGMDSAVDEASWGVIKALYR